MSIRHPKFCTELECLISVPFSLTLDPIWERNLASCWRVAINIISDLSSFNFNKFIDIHWLISTTHELILNIQDSLDSSDEAMNDAYNWVSSAYKWKS